LQQQIDNVRSVFADTARISIVVGFKLEMILEAHPDVSYIYNEAYDQTNTSKSLLKALRNSHESGVLWLNGDVVFDSSVLQRVRERMKNEKSFVCVNTSAVGEEEVKYNVDNRGFINALSKRVENALGEAVGINYISSHHKSSAIKNLEACADNDYFERGLEMAIEKDGIEIEPVDISDLFAVEVDFQADLDRANSQIN